MRAGQDHHPIADIGMADRGVGADLPIAPYGDARADHHAWRDAGAFTDLRARSDRHARTDRDIGRDPCIGRNRLGLRPLRLGMFGIEKPGDRGERLLHRCGFQQDHSDWRGGAPALGPIKQRPACDAANASRKGAVPEKKVICADDAPARPARSANERAPSGVRRQWNSAYFANPRQGERAAIFQRNGGRPCVALSAPVAAAAPAAVR